MYELCMPVVRVRECVGLARTGVRVVKVEGGTREGGGGGKSFKDVGYYVLYITCVTLGVTLAGHPV